MLTTRLAELNLSGTKLDAAALHVLRAELAYLPSLTGIDLSNHNVGLTGIRHLINANMRHLQHLNLADLNLDDGCIELLARAFWPDLASLNMASNHFSFSTYSIHRCVQSWQRLVFLHLPVECVTEWVRTYLEIKRTLPQRSFDLQNQSSLRLKRRLLPKDPSATDKQDLVWCLLHSICVS